MSNKKKLVKKNFQQAIFISFILIISFLFLRYLYIETNFVLVSIYSQDGSVKKAEIYASIANTQSLRRRGLMFVKEMPEDKGMIFVFPEETEHTFWMKNTYIPLDILFIDNNYRIVGIIKNAEPLSLKKLSVNQDSKYVLEISGGLSDKYNIQKGDIIKLSKKLQAEN